MYHNKYVHYYILFFCVSGSYNLQLSWIFFFVIPMCIDETVYTFCFGYFFTFKITVWCYPEPGGPAFSPACDLISDMFQYYLV